jgi:hypothetical protein
VIALDGVDTSGHDHAALAESLNAKRDAAVRALLIRRTAAAAAASNGAAARCSRLAVKLLKVMTAVEM